MATGPTPPPIHFPADLGQNNDGPKLRSVRMLCWNSACHVWDALEYLLITTVIFAAPYVVTASACSSIFFLLASPIDLNLSDAE